MCQHADDMRICLLLCWCIQQLHRTGSEQLSAGTTQIFFPSTHHSLFVCMFVKQQQQSGLMLLQNLIGDPLSEWAITWGGLVASRLTF